MVLYENGNVDYIYQTVASGAAEAMVGYCQGSGVQDPGPIDISTALTPSGFQTGNGAIPPVLGLNTNQRPQLNSTIVFETTNITPGTPFAVFALGFNGIAAPGFPLGFLNMPGCFQLIGLGPTLVTSFLPVVGGMVTTTLAIPGSASYLNNVLYAQAAPFTSGYNLAGIVTSNGLCVRVGL
jgi:hypothetical protein